MRQLGVGLYLYHSMEQQNAQEGPMPELGRQIKGYDTNAGSTTLQRSLLTCGAVVRMAGMLCSLVLFLLTTSHTMQVNKAGAYKLKTIVLDAGHGGKDPGCLGKDIYEKEVALAVVLELGKILKEELPGVKVVYTRDKDVFVELNERTAIANRNHADLFISVHCNSGMPKSVGSETYVMGLHKSQGNLDVAKRENDVVLKEDNYLAKYDGFDPKSPLAHIIFANFQSVHLANSLKLADGIEKYMKSRTNRKSRGVRQDGFLVLWKTAMPSVLCEIGYLSNKKDEAFLSSKKGQALIASSIFRAIRDYKKDVEQQPAPGSKKSKSSKEESKEPGSGKK